MLTFHQGLLPEASRANTYLALEFADGFSGPFCHYPSGLPDWFHHPQQTPVAANRKKTKSTFLSLTLQILGCQAKAQFRHSLGQTHLRFPRFPPNCPGAHTSAPLPMLFPPHSLSFHPLLYTSAQMSLPLGSLCILRGSYFCSLNAPRVPAHQS